MTKIYCFLFNVFFFILSFQNFYNVILKWRKLQLKICCKNWNVSKLYWVIINVSNIVCGQRQTRY
jgi:hypothetical protein